VGGPTFEEGLERARIACVERSGRVSEEEELGHRLSSALLPTGEIVRIRVGGEKMKAYLEPNEIEQLQNAATNLRDKLLIRVLFHLGCRISEALALKVEDIDFKQGTITIIHLKHRVKLSCANCGARIGMSHSFCPKCGVRINEAT